MYNKNINMNNEFLKMQKLAGLITEGEYKEKINENMFSTGDTVILPDAGDGMGKVILVTNYASHAEEIDDNIGMDWESYTPKEDLTWYKIEDKDGETYWYDEEELEAVQDEMD